MMRDVVIFDTTLRDGEQAPGNTMTSEEKMQVARQLDTLNVDVIEAGFPAASEGDYHGVRDIAAAVRRPVVAALARCTDRDIDLAGEALRGAEDRKSTRLNSSHLVISYAVFCLKKKKKSRNRETARTRVPVNCTCKALHNASMRPAKG